MGQKPGKKPTSNAVLDEARGCWRIEINTLQDLLYLIQEEGEIILDHYLVKDGTAEGRVILYDDYLE